MTNRHCRRVGVLIRMLCAFLLAATVRADVPLGGFIPLVGVGMTKEFDTFDSDPTGLYNIADPSFSWGSPPLGPGSAAFFDLALLDTGAATHILTQAAAGPSGFSIQAEGLRGTNFQTIFGAVAPVELRINDPAGVYVAGLGDRTGAGTALTMNTAAMRGQTSVATLEGEADWTLPNIIGLPMAAQHGIVIRNDQPQIFKHLGRTVRTPQVDFIDLGTGAAEGIMRRTNLRLRPSASFLAGPSYVPNLELGGGFELNLHDNPISPTVIDSGGMYVDVDLKNGPNYSAENVEFLFDTGADLTVVSEVMAASLGFDIAFDDPDFVLEVEGAGGVSGGVPGFYLDELKIDAVGGTLVMNNVPIAVLDVPNPVDPANVIDAILGMHVFTGRNLVIDAVPAASGHGASPRLYIGDPVTTTSVWGLGGSNEASQLTDAQAVNATSTPQNIHISNNRTIYRMTVAGTGAGAMTVSIPNEIALTTFGETLIKTGGVIELQNGGRLDAQFVNIAGGILTGTGEVFVGTGPVHGAVRNLSGKIDPSNGPSPVGMLEISGDLSNLEDGRIVIDLAGTAINQFDLVEADRFAFLGGTLEVRLANLGGGLFTPSVGNMFTILTAGDGVTGTFDQVLLPSGFQWMVDYQPGQVVLKVTGIGSIPGDFDSNGMVNAADLVAWKAGFPASYDGTDFLVWQRHLGQAPAAAVPEPAAAVVLACAMVCLAATQRVAGGHRYA